MHDAKLPTLASVKNTPSFFAATGLTEPAVRSHIFKAEDRQDSQGRKIAGNGLANTGAIVRRGGRIYIDVEKYGAWLAGAGSGV